MSLKNNFLKFKKKTVNRITCICFKMFYMSRGLVYFLVIEILKNVNTCIFI